ncbi:MAG: 2-oxoacid:ferredoxin oxidoreductase subunit beta [Leptospiraceae bacterium]|nr:2-oxoacid:ferredoxin oxidoreductase subunit beta [Leptospiraceae bacterium]
METNELEKKFKSKDYKSHLKPIWCPGCGDYGLLSGILKALEAIGRPPHEIAFISGIGCSSRIPGYTTTYGFNSLHGRALPIAQGVKAANPDLLVLVAGGDGDGFSIGGGHVAHCARRNLNITYMVMDNHIYGLTKGQLSPTSPKGLVSPSSQLGSWEEPINPLAYVLSYGAYFVAQGTPANMGELAEIIEEGIRFPGFSFINVRSPCVTFGQDEDMLKAQKAHLQSLKDLNHDTGDWLKAMDYARSYHEKLYTGVFYKNPSPPPNFTELAKERRKQEKSKAKNKEDILEMFRPKL